MSRQCRSKVELIQLGSAHEKYGVWTRPKIKFISQKEKKKGSADQSEIIPFDEYIFFARYELSRENKNWKNKPDRKNKWNHQKTVLGES